MIGVLPKYIVVNYIDKDLVVGIANVGLAPPCTWSCVKRCASLWGLRSTWLPIYLRNGCSVGVPLKYVERALGIAKCIETCLRREGSGKIQEKVLLTNIEPSIIVLKLVASYTVHSGIEDDAETLLLLPIAPYESEKEIEDVL